MLWPLRSSTPITVCGTRRTRIVSPTGSASPNSDRATVCPSSATLAAPSMSAASIGLPLVTLHSRAARYSGVMPRICVAQLLLPNTAWPLPRSCGAATAIPATSRCNAYASSSVIVLCDPEPWRTPPAVKLPERMMIRFEPRLLIWSSTRACAPRADGDHGDDRGDADDDAEHRQRRAQLVDAQRRQRDAQGGEEVHATGGAGGATAAVAAKGCGRAGGGRGAGGRARQGAGRAGGRRHQRRLADVGHEAPVAEHQATRRERRDVLLVRDDDDGDAARDSAPAAAPSPRRWSPNRARRSARRRGSAWGR